MAEKGSFIVLEGIDNCGKTTQAELLKKYLEKRNLTVIQTREPGGTEAGEEIRKTLLKPRQTMLDPLTQTLLFYAARKEFLNEVVKPNIDNGFIVISDRFEASTYVYQGLAQGVPLQVIDSLHQSIVEASGYDPDLYVIIDITAEESFRRLQNNDNQGQELVYEQQGLEFMRKLREGYLTYFTNRSKEDKRVVLVDGMLPKEKIQEQIIEHMKGILSK